LGVPRILHRILHRSLLKLALAFMFLFQLLLILLPLLALLVEPEQLLLLQLLLHFLRAASPPRTQRFVLRLALHQRVCSNRCISPTTSCYHSVSNFFVILCVLRECQLCPFHHFVRPLQILPCMLGHTCHSLLPCPGMSHQDRRSSFHTPHALSTLPLPIAGSHILDVLLLYLRQTVLRTMLCTRLCAHQLHQFRSNIFHFCLRDNGLHRLCHSLAHLDLHHSNKLRDGRLLSFHNRPIITGRIIVFV
jgi:hypothetical protein